MKLQRILAKDSRSANEQAIAKYGRDVLVISNNRVNGMTELIVAVDVEPEKMPPPVMPRGAGEPFEAALRQQLQAPTADGQAPGNAPAQGQAGSPGVAEAFIPAQMALMQAAQRAAAQSLGQTEPLRPTPAKANSPQPKAVRYAQQFRLSGPATSAPAALPLASLTVSRVLEGSATVASQERSPTEADTVHTPAPSAAAPQGPDGALSMATISSDKAHALTDLIRAEIAQLRKEVRMGQQLQAWAAQGPAHRWNEALSEVGVPTTLRALLMSGLSNDFDDQQALAAIEAQMAENLPKPNAQRGRRAAGAAWTSGVHLLSGPGGSGKT
ncbi:MAG: hypothetical protein ACKOCU_04555, partial [Betaproteobacteria bacterium]